MSSKSQYSQIKDILYPGLNNPPKNKNLIIRNIKHIRKLQNLNRFKNNKKSELDECKSYIFYFKYIRFY